MSERSVPAMPRAVLVLLAAFTAWPMLHIVLTAVQGSDAWKLGGFGMYATPRPRVTLRLEVDAGRGLAEYDPMTLDGPLQRKYAETRESMAILGAWASAEPLAAAILERYPAVRTVAVLVDTTVMDPEEATLVQSTARFTYGR